MNYLNRVVRHPGIFLAISTLPVLLVMSLVAWLANRDFEGDRELLLAKTLGTYAATLEGGTVNSRAMGAAILFGLENREAKQLVLGKMPTDAPAVLSAMDSLRTLYIADVVFLVNRQGVVVAYSSKDNTPGAGRDLSFRPYVQLAMQGTPNVYPAVGVISPDRGIFLAAPLRAATNNISGAIGAVVVKIGADKLDTLLNSWTDGFAVLLSPQGVAFATSRVDWLFRIAGKVSAKRIAEIQLTGQFGKLFDQAARAPLPFTLDTPETRIDGVRYVVRSLPLEWNDPEGDWKLAFVERRDPWWGSWGVLGLAGFAGLVTSLAMFWFYSLMRNAFLLERINGELATEAAKRKIFESQIVKSLSLQQATLESTNDAILVVDLNNTWVLYNQRFVDLWHISDAILEARDDSAALSFVLNQLEDADGFLNKVRELYSTPVANSFDIIKFKDGKIIERYSIPQYIDEKVVGRVWSFHDATERKLAESALRESMLQLEEKELAKTRFLAAASHDLRQPLAAANLFIDALKFTAPSAGQNQIIQRLEQAMSTFNGLLDALLNISKLDAGIIKPVYASTKIAEIFNWLEQSFSPMAREKQLDFRLYFPMKQKLVVRTDINLVKSVLMNLVSNAIKYTSKGAILVSARRRGGEVLFQVWDTGIGIPDEYIAHIFDEFYQINNPQRDRTSGLGLGLSIAKRALTLMGGKIVCRSQFGRGSVFGFCLPLDDSQSKVTQQTGTETQQEYVNPKEFVRGKCFIVVEDDVLVAEAICKTLAMMGGEVKCFQNAEVALGYPEIGNADYYIVDYMLGGEHSGIEFLNLLRQKLERPIKAVLMTGDTSTNFIRKAEMIDWPVLHKPVNISKLLHKFSKQI